MRSKRAKLLRQEARNRAMNGKVISNVEYKKLKRSYNNKTYAPVVVQHPSKPDVKFSAQANLERYTGGTHELITSRPKK